MIKPDPIPVVEKAGEIIISCTLFENPLASTSELNDWISSEWNDTFRELKRGFEDCDWLCRREARKAPSILTANSVDWRLANHIPNGCNNVKNSYRAATGV